MSQICLMRKCLLSWLIQSCIEVFISIYFNSCDVKKCNKYRYLLLYFLYGASSSQRKDFLCRVTKLHKPVQNVQNCIGCTLSQSLDLCLAGWLPILLASVQCWILHWPVFSVGGGEFGEFRNLSLSDFQSAAVLILWMLILLLG